MKTKLALSLLVLATLVSAADDPEAGCRSRLRNLGGAISAYRLIHENKPPAKLSDLYLDGLVTSLEDFVCPASGSSIKADSEIDAKSDYTLEPAAGAKDMMVREKTARHPAGALAIFADGSIKAVGAPSAAASSPSQPAATPGTASGAASPSPSPVAATQVTPPVVSLPSSPNVVPSPSAEAEAAYELGLQYDRGGGAALIDHKKAYESFQRAAEQNLPEAQARLAELWSQRGWYDFQHAADAAKAADLAKQALTGGLEGRAEAGKHQSEYELGSLYLYGLGVQKDEARAAKLFRTAADHGNKDAKRALGYLYWTGTGVTSDIQAAEQYLKAAAAENVVTAQLLLGLLYSTGASGVVPKSGDVAFAFFQQAAEQSLPTAMDKVAECFEKGTGVQQNLAKAVEWYQRAAERGVWSSQQKLGEMYEQGRGVTKDLAKAAEYYKKVADQDITQGKEALARVMSEKQPKGADTSAAPSGTGGSNQTASIVGEWSANDSSGGKIELEFKEDATFIWRFLAQKQPVTVRGKYEIDRAVQPARIRMFEMDNPLAKELLGLFELQTSSRLKLDLASSLQQSRDKGFTNEAIMFTKGVAAPGPTVATTPSSKPATEAEALASKGDYDGAIALLNKAIALHPEDAEAFYQRAWCYSAKKAWDNVIADADKALALGYRQPGYAYTLRGEGRLGKSDFKGCIEDATKAIALIPNSLPAYIQRAQAGISSGNWENVLEDCNKYLALLPTSDNDTYSPQRAAAYMLRGYYYSHVGATEAAEADWKKAIALNPSNEQVVKAYRNTFTPKKKPSRKR